MSFEQELDRRKAEQKTYISPADVPETVTAVVQKHVFKTDQKGNECAYIYLETNKGDMIVQKYTPTAFEMLAAALKKAGGIGALGEGMHEWRLQTAGRMMNRRLFPTPQAKETKK